jgi:hypothetical protein
MFSFDQAMESNMKLFIEEKKKLAIRIRAHTFTE